MNSLHPLTQEHLHCVDAETVKKTLAESKLTYSIDLGRGFTLHHGTRDKLPIVIVECEDQKHDEVSCVWFDETNFGSHA